MPAVTAARDDRLLPVDPAERRRLLADDPRLWRRWLVAQTRGLELARCEAALSMARPDHDADGWRVRGWSQRMIEDRARGWGPGAWLWGLSLDWARDDDVMPLP